MNQGRCNEEWGKILIAELIYHGVTYFCLSPGFRSTSLAIALAENPHAKTFVHFDERGAAFHALGYAKATKKPVAIITTSGTAVGNLMPAVMEAWAAHVPLILLTCDRPISLRDTMANQTADQVKIFGDYVRYFFELPSPSYDTISKNFLATTIAQAVARALFPIQGPIHLNCLFPEPFCSEKKEEVPLSTHHTTCFYPTIALENPKQWAEELQSIEKGVLILGGNALAPSAKDLSQKLGWPIFADILSSFRERGSQESIPYYHHILGSLPDFQADVIIHLGDALVSKTLLHWMTKAKRLIHVATHPKRCDPLHAVTDRVICPPEIFCKEVSKEILPQNSNWLSLWQSLGTIAKEQCSFPFNSEPGVIQWIEKLATPKTALFFGNSMPIRDADMFFFPQKSCGPIFANRGLSGIDGNIATVAGIAQRLPVIAVMGDQTALHDLNSLAQLQKTKHPVRLIIINNGGGGIFSFRNIRNREELLDPFFAAAHTTTFSHAAQMFGLTYTLVKNQEDVANNSTLFEIITEREENFLLHQHIDKQVQNALETFNDLIGSLKT